MAILYTVTVSTLRFTEQELIEGVCIDEKDMIDEIIRTPFIEVTTSFYDLKKVIERLVSQTSTIDACLIKEQVESMNCFRWNLLNPDCNEVFNEVFKDVLISINSFKI